MGRRIGIDARFYGEAGPGRYTKNIISYLEKIDLENEYVVFLRAKNFSDYIPQSPRFSKVLAEYKWYSWGEQFGLLFLLLKHKLAIYYVPHFNIPVLYPFQIITAIPDIIMHTFSTEKGTTLPKPYFRLKKLVYKLVVFLALIRSKKVLVPSNDVLNDFLHAYPMVGKTKYVVAYEGVDPVFYTALKASPHLFEEFGIRKPYLLYISSMYEHKNVRNLIAAFEILQSRYEFDGQLVLVGKKDKYSAAISELVIQKGLADKVILPGNYRYIPDSDTLELRKHAALYTFPSLKEGFSLTPLEAQAVGLPCVISDIPCHREIFGDSVLYFNPLDPNEIAQKIHEVLATPELSEELVTKGYAQVAKYDWEETAQATLSEFKRVLKIA